MSPKPAFYWWKLYLHEWRWSSFGIHCVAKPSMDPPKRWKRSPRLYAPHGRQKHFSILGDLFQISSSCLRVSWIILSNYFWLQIGGKLPPASLRASAPIYPPPPPPTPLGARNNASLAGYITQGPQQAMKISEAGEGLAIARGRVAEYLRFFFFFQIVQKKTQVLYKVRIPLIYSQ